ncbi:MAG: helix-turn-helix transcriptional regulator, partial [Bacteroidales bacterium]|nr:helix-turn-helix transcriptional regulator [Bacteroidales bacterium]
MKDRDNTNRIEELLNRNEELTAAVFFRAFPGDPSPTVYSKIRALVQSGELSRVGKGRYVAVRKPAFKVEVTEWMLEVNGYMINNCEGVN